MDFIKELEIKEIIEKLYEQGYGEIINGFLLNEGKCYTKKGRLNKSGACRILDMKIKTLDEKFKEIRELLAKELDIEYKEDEIEND